MSLSHNLCSIFFARGTDESLAISYYIAANPSIERHLQSVRLPSLAQFSQLKAGKTKVEMKEITNSKSGIGYYRCSFSPFAGFYVLNYGQSDSGSAN